MDVRQVPFVEGFEALRHFPFFVFSTLLELYLPALLGGLEQVSTIREAAGGDSRRGDSAAPAATELNYMEKFISRSTG